MIRFPLACLLLFSLCLAWPDAASAQAPTWTVTKVERSETGFVEETKLNPTTGLTETKKLLVFGKKNEFLHITMTVRPDKKGALPFGDNFKVVVDENGKQKVVGKRTFYLKGMNNVVTMVFQGDWTSLDGLTLLGPGSSTYALGKKKQ